MNRKYDPCLDRRLRKLAAAGQLAPWDDDPIPDDPDAYLYQDDMSEEEILDSIDDFYDGT